MKRVLVVGEESSGSERFELSALLWLMVEDDEEEWSSTTRGA